MQSYNPALHTYEIDSALAQSMTRQATVRFNQSPVFDLNHLPNFVGSGIYALYLDLNASAPTQHPRASQLNQAPLVASNCASAAALSVQALYGPVVPSGYPVYVGKAAAPGVRQGARSTLTHRSLYLRLLEHKRSLLSAGFNLDQVQCRHLVFDANSQELIPFFESALISAYRPLWNSFIDGFGIHAPGSGRNNQQPSEWDTLHPGRPWVKSLTGAARSRTNLLDRVNAWAPVPSALTVS